MRSIAVFMLSVSLCTAEMIMHFPFSEDKGTSTADAAGAVTGTIQNASWADGIRGSALRFDPANKSAVIVKTSLRELAGISVSLWFRGDGDQKDPHLINCIGDGKQGFRIFMNGGILIWQIPSAEIPWGYRLGATEACTSGQWNHAVCTYDGNAMCIYINGKAAGTMKRSGVVVPSTTPLFIGAYSDGGTAVFSGIIDEVTIYDYALTLEEVKALNEATRRSTATATSAKANRVDLNADAIEAARTNPNEMKSPGFENGTEQWNMQPPWKIAESEGINGSRAAVLEYDSSKHHKFIDQAVTVIPNTFYGIRIWVRSELKDDTHIVRGAVFFAGDAKSAPLYTYTSYSIEFDYWAPIYHFFNSGENAQAKLSLYLENYPSSGNIWIDDAAMWKISDDDLRGNLIPNPDFELNADGDFPVCWADGLAWQKEKRPPLKISVDSAGDFIRGNASLKLDGSSFTAADMENGVVSVAVPAMPGKEYRLSIWMKAQKPETMARLMIDGFQPGKTHWFKQTYVTLDAGWRRYSFEARIPDASDAKYYLPVRLIMARIMVKGPNILWADEVRLVQK